MGSVEVSQLYRRAKTVPFMYYATYCNDILNEDNSYSTDVVFFLNYVE